MYPEKEFPLRVSFNQYGYAGAPKEVVWDDVLAPGLGRYQKAAVLGWNHSKTLLAPGSSVSRIITPISGELREVKLTSLAMMVPSPESD